MKIILGSQSKARRKILSDMGYDFDVMSAGIDEKAIRHDDPEKLVLLLARAKADALLNKINDPALLITSDQVVVCDGEIREKPESPDEARDFLKSYAVHPAETVTGVVVTNTQTGEQVEGVDVAKMYFKEIDDKTIDALIKEGDIMWCAGGFIGEHELLKPFITKLEGDVDSIMGLPKKLIKVLIEKMNKDD